MLRLSIERMTELELRGWIGGSRKTYLATVQFIVGEDINSLK